MIGSIGVLLDSPRNCQPRLLRIAVSQYPGRLHSVQRLVR